MRWRTSLLGEEGGNRSHARERILRRHPNTGTSTGYILVKHLKVFNSACCAQNWCRARVHLGI